MKNKELFLTENSIASPLIDKYEYPFEVLPNIKDYIISLGNSLDEHYKKIGEDIWISNTASISKSAEIIGPCIIDDEAEINHNAYIRGNVIIGKKCVFGNSCEAKNAIIYDETKIPHFNYVGDSIIGYKIHLGAGVIASNRKNGKSNVIINKIDTNSKKVGAFIGDEVEVGCNTVLNPGTVIGPNTSIYPLSCVRGVIPSNMIYKSKDEIIKKIS